jgi:hypothetical protein
MNNFDRQSTTSNPCGPLGPLVSTGFGLLLFTASMGYAAHLVADHVNAHFAHSRNSAEREQQEILMAPRETQHHESTGPQIGYAAVMEDGTVYVSREKRPAMALSDINAQISQANASRYAVGKAPHEGPKHVGQLHPYFANRNPDIQALLDGLCPQGRVGCPAGSQAQGTMRRTDAAVRTQAQALAARKLKPAPPTDDYESGLGWTERVA